MRIVCHSACVMGDLYVYLCCVCVCFYVLGSCVHRAASIECGFVYCECVMCGALSGVAGVEMCFSALCSMCTRAGGHVYGQGVSVGNVLRLLPTPS